MSLILNKKIGVKLPGTPTYADKYDVITAIVGTKPVVSGQLVAFDKVFTEGGMPTVEDITTTSKYVGVVMHQNIKVEAFNDGSLVQTFKPGEVIGVCFKGFVLALAHKDFDLTVVEQHSGFFDKTTSGKTTLPANVKLTGWAQLDKNLDRKIVEVQLL